MNVWKYVFELCNYNILYIFCMAVAESKVEFLYRIIHFI